MQNSPPCSFSLYPQGGGWVGSIKVIIYLLLSSVGNLCKQSEPYQNRQNVRPDLDTGEKQISNRADFWKLNCMNWEDREAGYGDRGGGGGGEHG